jgi:hypothetical protein
MVKLYFNRILLKLCFTGLSSIVLLSYAHATIRPDSTRNSVKPKITDTRKEKPAFLKSNLKVAVVPFKPAVLKPTNSTTQSPKPSTINEKVLSNVKVYPNPVSDQLNVSFHVSKDAIMTVKMMDFLGNDLGILGTQRIVQGDQTASFNIGSKFNSGLYFIRFVVGNETVIKRISIL